MAERGDVLVQLHSQVGVALAALATIASGGEPRLAADTRGGYVLAYTRDSGGYRHLYGRRLDAAGVPVGGEIAVDQMSAAKRGPPRGARLALGVRVRVATGRQLLASSL